MPDLRQHHFVQLFGFEVCGGRNSPLWHNPQPFFGAAGAGGKGVMPPIFPRDTQYDQAFADWQQQKRVFTKEEIPGCYVLIGDNGQAFIRWLHADGNLTEKPLFDQSQEWGGKWRVKDGILSMEVDIYSVYAVASKEGEMHGAIQKKRQEEPIYFKVIRVQ